MVIAKIVLYLSLFIHYGHAISKSDLTNLKAELKKEIFEDERLKRLYTRAEHQQSLLDELLTKIDQLSSNLEQHRDELKKVSSDNVAVIKKLAEHKPLLEEYKSELDRQKSENELRQEAFENRLSHTPLVSDSEWQKTWA